MLENYLLNNHRDELEDILNNTHIHHFYSIHINFVSLFEANSDVAQKILRQPRYYLPLCNAAAIKVQEQIAKPDQVVKKKIRIRVTAVPIAMEQGQIGHLISTSGIVVRISQPTVLKLFQRYNCKKCKHVTIVKYEWEIQAFAETTECEACHATNIIELTQFDLEDSSDSQDIRIQERDRMHTNKSFAEDLQIILLDDLVDKCRPGDYVEISGIIIRVWEPLEVGERSEATTMMIANSISVRRKMCDLFSTQETRDIFKNYWTRYSNNPLLGRDNIIASICPQLYGMYTAKLALAIVLAGGVAKENEGGTRVRGEPHLLLIGDPGTGKSQLLHTASRLAVRSVLTTGVGSTTAGLTATAVRDVDGWHLEAGALVLADGGICCVDEFTTMSAQDRTSIHEAMEQQTISIAKAGLVSTLNSRCTVIAAINPSGGEFDEEEEWETNLGDPLLSRFDLILLLKDNKNPEWDKLMSDHILKAAYEYEDNASQSESTSHTELLKAEGLWKTDTLREYFAHIHSLEPQLTKEAELILRKVYMYHRSDSNRREERTTVRLLDSLIRLAEGHARLMYRSKIEVMDAIFVAKLVGTGTTSEVDLGCPFPTNPLATYKSDGKNLLKTMNLQQLENLL
ncbi:DNA helicase MCM9 [Calliopsis andreniformis]|uniref:DNA helicase MCM9 n=1 Tax=Calliopsis andreniformis TaxID=337506 RepID=UPI003FCD8259